MGNKWCSLLSYSTKMFTFNVSAKILQFSSNKCIRFANNRFNSSSSSKFVYSKWSQTRLPTNFSRSFMTSPCRFVSQPKYQGGDRNKSTIYYVLALGVFVGTTSATGHKTEGLENMKPNRERVLRIRFNADTSSNLTWNFKPQQSEIKVALGETALAFYTATNPTD